MIRLQNGYSIVSDGKSSEYIYESIRHCIEKEFSDLEVKGNDC